MLRSTTLGEIKGKGKPFNLSKKTNGSSHLLSSYIPASVRFLLPFQKGEHFNLEKEEKDGRLHFKLELIGETEGTWKLNKRDGTQKRDVCKVWGSFPSPVELTLDGDYHIFLPTILYNLHFHQGIRSGEPELIYFHPDTKNTVVFTDSPTSCVRRTYAGEVPREVRVNNEDYINGVSTTIEMKEDLPYLIIRSTLKSRLMLSLTEFEGVNEKTSVPFAPSIPDNEENAYIRFLFGLGHSQVRQSRLTSKDAPFLQQMVTDNTAGYTAVATFTKEGVIYDLYFTQFISNDDMANSKALSKRLESFPLKGREPDCPLIVKGKVVGILHEFLQRQREIFEQEEPVKFLCSYPPSLFSGPVFQFGSF